MIMRQSRCLFISSLLLALFVSNISFAVEPGFYMGMNALSGAANADDVTDKGNNSTTYEPDGNSLSGGGFIFGYTTSEHFSMELAADALTDVDYTTTSGSDTASRSQYIIYLAAKPMIPVTKKLNLFARLGLGYMRANIDFNASGGDNYSEGELSAYGALGLSYTPTPSLEISLGYNQLSNNEGDLQYGSLEFTHHFITARDQAGFLID
jgi:hypothetical protein